MDPRLSKLRGEFLDLMESQVAEAYRKILTDPATHHKTRLEAARDLMDRFGFPALKASITQSVSAQVEVESILKTREGLIEERKQIKESLDALMARLGDGDDQKSEGRVCGEALSREGQGQDDQEVQVQGQGQCLPPEDLQVTPEEKK